VGKTFGARFKSLRNELGLTQDDLAKEFNKRYFYSFTKSSISMYENNKQVPEIDVLQKWANFFLVTIDYLLGKSDTRTYKIQDELPEELKNLGVEYLTVTKEAKEKGLSPEDLRKIIDAVTAIKKSNNNN
jgi:transcriptional regulator with XRE-family HTH domain